MPKTYILMDLKAFVRSTRKFRKRNPLWALTPEQKQDLLRTCTEAIQAIQSLQKEVANA